MVPVHKTSTPSYQELVASHTITPLEDTGTLSQYTLTPVKAGGRVIKLIVTVNDAQALVDRIQYYYADGSTLDIKQSYSSIGGFQLPVKTDIVASFRGYSADGTLSFGAYQPNAPVPSSVFADH